MKLRFWLQGAALRPHEKIAFEHYCLKRKIDLLSPEEWAKLYEEFKHRKVK